MTLSPVDERERSAVRGVIKGACGGGVTKGKTRARRVSTRAELGVLGKFFSLSMECER